MKRLLTFTTLTALCFALVLPSTSSSSIAMNEAETEFSPEMELFVEHLQSFYFYDVSDPHINYNDYVEKTLLIGFALGRQAINVTDDEERKRIFQKIEHDILQLFVSMAIQMRKGRDGTYDTELVTKDAVKAWKHAQMAMMGFYDDLIIPRRRINTGKIPNMFVPLSKALGDAVAGVYETWPMTGTNLHGTLVLNGNMDRVEFDYKWGSEQVWHWTGVLEWDGKDTYKERKLEGLGFYKQEQMTRKSLVVMKIKEGIDGKWRGFYLSLGGSSYNLKKIL